MHKESPIERLFLSLSRYGKRFIDTKILSKITNHDLSLDIKTLFDIKMLKLFVK